MRDSLLIPDLILPDFSAIDLKLFHGLDQNLTLLSFRMIRFLNSITAELEAFIENKDWAVKIKSSFNKNVWCVVNEDPNGRVTGLVLFSFMYSTWTRFNPFILFSTGTGLSEMVSFLKKSYAELPIRGYIRHKETESITKLNPNNLTQSEDWVWLRLEDLNAFEACKLKGSKRLEEKGLELGSFKIQDVIH